MSLYSRAAGEEVAPRLVFIADPPPPEDTDEPVDTGLLSVRS